jgi:rhodanese-related sulfurtransferase
VLDVLSTMGTTALIVLAVLLLLFVSFKYVERKRFHQSVDIERITIDELKNLLEQGHEPVMIDARSVTAQMLEPAVPGALLFNGGDPNEQVASLDKGRHIIVYCSCPNDVTAAHVAKGLIGNGYKRARPLHGGLDAWNAAFGTPAQEVAENNTASV